MQKLTITEAVKVIPVSESKLRRDMKAGVVSFEVDEKGKKRFDPSELARVYGQIALARRTTDRSKKAIKPRQKLVMTALKLSRSWRIR